MVKHIKFKMRKSDGERKRDDSLSKVERQRKPSRLDRKQALSIMARLLAFTLCTDTFPGIEVERKNFSLLLSSVIESVIVVEKNNKHCCSSNSANEGTIPNRGRKNNEKKITVFLSFVSQRKE